MVINRDLYVLYAFYMPCLDSHYEMGDKKHIHKAYAIF